MFIRLVAVIFCIGCYSFLEGYAQKSNQNTQSFDFLIGTGMGSLSANFLRPNDLVFAPTTVNAAINYQLFGLTNININSFFVGTFGLNTYFSSDSYASSWQIGLMLAGFHFYPLGKLKRLVPWLAIHGGYGLINYTQLRQELSNPLFFNRITFTEQQFKHLGIGNLQLAVGLDWVWWSGLRQVKGLNLAVVGAFFRPQSTGLNYWDNLYFKGISLNLGIKVGPRGWMV